VRQRAQGLEAGGLHGGQHEGVHPAAAARAATASRSASNSGASRWQWVSIHMARHHAPARQS
jgi:hypothetical protein